MLCNKIHKVAMATTLWTMALLGASLANAVIDFDKTGAMTGTVIYSAEGLVADSSRRMAARGADASFFAISASGTLLTAQKTLERLAVYRLGQAAAGDGTNNDVWVRVEASGGLKLFRETGLTVQAAGGCFVGISADSTLSGNGVYIYQLNPDTTPLSGCAQFPGTFTALGAIPRIIVPLGRKNDGSNDDVTPTTATTAVSAAAAGMLTVSAYETAQHAWRGEDNDARLFTDTVLATNTASSLKVDIAKATAPATADVETGFTKFVGGSPNSATLGFPFAPPPPPFPSCLPSRVSTGKCICHRS